MRIRTIKPEFWMDEELASLPMVTRLVYIALWNEADDEGRLRANPRYLKGALFPYDDLDIEPHLDSLRAHGKLSEYSVRAQTFAVINNFSKHQRINRPSPSKLPEPPENMDTAVIHGGLSEGSVRAHSLNREQGTGNREQGTGNREQTPQGARACEGLDYWNLKTGQKRRGSAIKKAVASRVKDFSLDEVMQVVDWVVTSKDDRAQFLRDRGLEPETVFRPANFEKYLERSKAQPANKNPMDMTREERMEWSETASEEQLLAFEEERFLERQRRSQCH